MSADIERWDPPNDPTAFESLCLDLWRDIWQDHAQKNGRRGQPQAGVDVFGRYQGMWIGVQCKQKDGLRPRSRVTIKELDEEAAAARQFRPPLSTFILATTGPRDDELQRRARELTDQNVQLGLFTVEVWAWEDIWSVIYGRESLFKRIAPLYWPRLGAMLGPQEASPADLRSNEPPLAPEIRDRMERARIARRRHDFALAQQLWDEVDAIAGLSSDPRISIRARLEKVHLQLQDDGDPDEALKTIETCLAESKHTDLGKQRARVLQLLGEVHRIKGNVDQARGFLGSAGECARAAGDKCDEGWALLALAAVGYERGTSPDAPSRLELIRQAYDCFSAVYAAGDDDSRYNARDGFAACHSWRAQVLDHRRIDEALVEYGRAMDVYKEMGEDTRWEFAETLRRRGDLQARADEATLAAKDLLAASELFENLGDYVTQAKCISEIAELLDRRGHRVKSKEYFKAAAQTALRQNNLRKAGGFLFRYACKLGELREFDEQEVILTGLLSADWLTSGQRLDILKTLCLSAKASGQDDAITKYSNALLEILDDQITNARSADERRRLILSKGHTLEDLEQHDRALGCYRRALEAYEAAGDRGGLIESWFCIGQVMGRTRKRKEERQAYETILSLVGHRHNVFHYPMTLTMLAQLDIREERFDEARAHLDRAEQENEALRIPLVSLIVQDLRRKLPDPRNSGAGE